MPVIRRSNPQAPRRARGFSLIEVLVALVVLAVGLLGVAMMQTVNLRFTQSANHRTIATNLAYELLDLARSNRVLSARYAMTYAQFGTPTVPSTGCARGTAADPDTNVARWKCEVRASLPNGEAQVVFLGNGRLRVDMRWTDAHWQAANQQTEFSVESRL
jgi:type IV pilus assembly protein PilV